MCSTLVCSSNFLQVNSAVCINAQKKGKKANREKFKYV